MCLESLEITPALVGLVLLGALYLILPVSIELLTLVSGLSTGLSICSMSLVETTLSLGLYCSCCAEISACLT